MKKVLFLFITVCIFAGAVNFTEFYVCGKDYSPCNPIRYPKGHNPYKAAVHRTPLMRQRAHGYLQVRPGAYLFYQLYYANGTKAGAPNHPLIIWIQGGPGFAASGIGNFAEIGPLDMDFKPRNHTWVKKRNVLLIDHPVGSGFSYAVNDSLLAKTDREVAIDLSRAIKLFLRRRSEFRRAPTYLIGQSYGGKITPRLALYLHTAIQNNNLIMNFKGIAIGGGWVNPKESTLAQPDFLYHTGAIDKDLYVTAKKISLQLARVIDNGSFTSGAILDDLLFQTINKIRFINFNNVNTNSPYTALEYLTMKMNQFVKPTLRNVNQTIRWRYLSGKAYHSLKNDFVVPSYSFLEKLLDNSDLKIVIYNGNLDIITPIAESDLPPILLEDNANHSAAFWFDLINVCQPFGASNWVHKLRWHGARNFSEAWRYPIKGERNGFYKQWKRFSFWTVFGAGHWVPQDNPEAMEHILQHLTAEDVDLRSLFRPSNW